MPSWYIKAGIQGVLSLFPNPTQLNYFFQRHVTHGLPKPVSRYGGYIGFITHTLTTYQDHHNRLPNNILELGTGWEPVVPILYALSDVEQIHTVDINALLNPDLFAQTLQNIEQAVSEHQQHLPFLRDDALSRLQSARRIFQNSVSIEETLAFLNVKTHVADIRDLSESLGNSFELAVSYNTFEHIHRDMMLGILESIKGLLDENGLFINSIDMTDHYSHFDKSITPYHFLRHEDFMWKLVNNPLQYQNRFRISDFRDMYAQAGFHILDEVSRVSEQHIESIERADRFQHYSLDDISVIRSLITAT